MAAGLAQAQEARSAWTGADLVHAIVQNLPDHANSQDQEATRPTACAGRTGRASTGPGGQAVRHPAQLSIGQQLLADAYAEGAPQLAYEQAAALLGVGHRWSDSPCHRGPDHGAGLHKGHGAGRREYSSVLMSRVGAAHQGADPARHAGAADPEQRALGRTQEVHLHFHEVSATIIARQNKAGE
jgi:hypothetical protein